MATPFGHGLAGAIVCLGFRRAGWETPSIAAAVVAANLPDFDFLPGILIGHPGRYHHGVTHSFGAVVIGAVLIGAVWAGLGRLRPGIGPRTSLLRIVIFFGACLLSHVLIDYATVDSGKEIGIPILWPLTGTDYMAPYPIFKDVWRKPLFSRTVIIHDLKGMVLEAVLFLPLLALLLIATRRSRGGLHESRNNVACD